MTQKELYKKLKLKLCEIKKCSDITIGGRLCKNCWGKMLQSNNYTYSIDVVYKLHLDKWIKKQND